MTEVLEGKGTLCQEVQPPAEWEVRYHFVITTNLVTRPGFPPAVGKSHSEGTVTAINGDFLPAGYFELTAQDGEILRVQSHGFGPWMILSPMA
jgi:hypothetical protein